MCSYKNSNIISVLEGILPKSRNRDFLRAANKIVKENILTLPPFGEVRFLPMQTWKDEGKSRSLMRLIHGHTFLGCLSDAYLKSGDIKFLVKGKEIILDWIENNPKENTKNGMAYHDETTALRLQYWLKFYLISKKGIKDKVFVDTLKKEMDKTAALLSDDQFHSFNTNHGMFQDLALLTFSIYFRNENNDLYQKYWNLGIIRLRRYFEFVFTSDGVHKEQSPIYHMLVTANLKRLVSFLKDIDQEETNDFEKIYKSAEEFATHIIRPDGYLPPICDTEPKSVDEVGYKNLFNTDQYLYSVTSGVEGKAPDARDVVFKEAGYAIFRSSWEEKDKATYVLYTAAYNSDYHKHSDDLNLYIYSDGEIITEAGPNGYNYKDEFTKYAYSSNAHNTLLVDGKGLPRVDGKFEDVFLKNYKISENKSVVTGINNRFEDVSHTRKVSFDKDKKIIEAIDSIESNSTHEYRLLWHVSSEVEVVKNNEQFDLYRQGRKIMEIEIDSISPFKTSIVSEQIEPYIQGWQFPKMEKKKGSSTIIIDFNGSNSEFRTIFRMSEFKLNDSIPLRNKSGKGFNDNVTVNSLEINSIDVGKTPFGNIELECLAQGDDLEYAYYVYRDDKVIEKFFYTKRNTFYYKVNHPGVYRVRVFVRSGETKIAKYSDAIIFK